MVSPEHPDSATVQALLAGQAEVFEALFEQYYPLMLRLALPYVGEKRLAEEVIQETWMAVLRGLANFEGRSSLKTWISSILVNRAKTYAQREGRFDHVTLLEEDETESTTGTASVSLDRFYASDHAEWPQEWRENPQRWEDTPERQLLVGEVLEQIEGVLATLPAKQAQVMILRDLQGWSAEEVCQALGVSEANHRVLLHRARAKVRQALEDYWGGH
jgi:RNA polymerase sigma-70 factor (ECF subfamily)